MDIKAKISELVDKLKADPNLAAKFQKDPAATVKELIGVDLPGDQLEKLVDGVRAKLSADKLGGALGGLLGRK